MFNSYPTIRWRKYKVSGETKSRFPPSLYHPTRPASSAEATNAAHYYLSYVVSCKMDQFLSNKTYFLHRMSTLANRIFCSGLAWSSTPARTLIVSMHNKEKLRNFLVFCVNSIIYIYFTPGQKYNIYCDWEGWGPSCQAEYLLLFLQL